MRNRTEIVIQTRKMVAKAYTARAPEHLSTRRKSRESQLRLDLHGTFLRCRNLGIKLVQLLSVHLCCLGPLELEPANPLAIPSSRLLPARDDALRWRKKIIINRERVQVKVAILHPFITRELVLPADLV